MLASLAILDCCIQPGELVAVNASTTSDSLASSLFKALTHHDLWGSIIHTACVTAIVFMIEKPLALCL